MNSYWKGLLQSNERNAYVQAVQQSNAELKGFIKFNPDDSNLLDARKKYYTNIDKANAPHSLADIPFAIKNNIAIENMPLTCASHLLANFISPISATSIQQLLSKGLVPVGLTNMDEFGMGSDNTNTIFGAVKNPWDNARTAGGSSGGSAAVVSSGAVPIALGSDTGGSVRQPAAFCGLWGLKPTYGAVSRYGLVAFASSLDVIGVLAEHPKWLLPVFEAMRVDGKDPKDASAYYPDARIIHGTKAKEQVGAQTLPHAKVKTIAFCSAEDFVNKAVQESMAHAKSQYIKAGYTVEEIALPVVEYSPAVYMNISTAEASSNLARFDGIRYGGRGGYADNHLELVRNARNTGFGNEVKLRIITGGFVLRSGFQEQFYIKAQKLRKHIKKLMYEAFAKYDIVVMPVSPIPAFELGNNSLSPLQQKLADAYSVIANLSGAPAVSFPVAWKDGLPIGIQALAPHYAEQRLCNFVQDTYSLFEYQSSPYAMRMFESTARTGGVHGGADNG